MTFIKGKSGNPSGWNKKYKPNPDSLVALSKDDVINLQDIEPSPALASTLMHIVASELINCNHQKIFIGNESVKESPEWWADISSRKMKSADISSQESASNKESKT